MKYCEADLKPEKQGDKMDAFFQSNNNTSLPVLSKQGLNVGFVRTQGTELFRCLSLFFVLQKSPWRQMKAQIKMKLSLGIALRQLSTHL
jgi:hypothetical protein